MHATQTLYAAAKAQMDVLREECRRITDAIPEDAPDYIERVVAAEDECGYWQAIKTLKSAEDAMIEWARQTILNTPHLARRYREVAPVFEKGTRSVTIRPKLVDVCFRLAA